MIAPCFCWPFASGSLRRSEAAGLRVEDLVDEPSVRPNWDEENSPAVLDHSPSSCIGFDDARSRADDWTISLGNEKVFLDAEIALHRDLMGKILMAAFNPPILPLRAVYSLDIFAKAGSRR